MSSHRIDLCANAHRDMPFQNNRHDLHDRVSSGLGLLYAMRWYDPRSSRIRV